MLMCYELQHASSGFRAWGFSSPSTVAACLSMALEQFNESNLHHFKVTLNNFSSFSLEVEGGGYLEVNKLFCRFILVEWFRNTTFIPLYIYKVFIHPMWLFGNF